MEKTVICKNCGHRFEGKFCNICGQEADTERVDWHEILHHLPHAFFHTDNGLLHTLKEMTVRPGHTIREYMEGKRVDHFNPFLFVILLGGFAVFLFATADVKLISTVVDLHAIESSHAILAHQYFLIPAFIMTLLFAITDYFIYREKKYIMPELIVSNIFQMGQLLALVILSFPLLYLQDAYKIDFGWQLELRSVIKAIMVVYFFYVRYQLYDAKNNPGVIVKIALQVLGIYCLYHFVIERLINAAFS
ncbi:DUF3667 domain-containing protein [Flavitalea antarctica]